MKRHAAAKEQRANHSKASEGDVVAPSAILQSVSIVSDKRFRLDIELRHTR